MDSFEKKNTKQSCLSFKPQWLSVSKIKMTFTIAVIMKLLLRADSRRTTGFFFCRWSPSVRKLRSTLIANGGWKMLVKLSASSVVLVSCLFRGFGFEQCPFRAVHRFCFFFNLKTLLHCPTLRAVMLRGNC